MSANNAKLRISSIGRQLFLLALGTLLPVVLFAAILAVLQARDERQTFERGMQAVVVGIKSAIDAELRATVVALRTLAESQALIDGDLQQFHGIAARVSNLNRDWVTVILAGVDGVSRVNAIHAYGAEPLRVEETASFEAVLRTRQPTIGSLSSGPLGKRMAFPVRVPVLRNGQLAYVLTAVVDPQAIARIVREQGMPADWVASVVDLRLSQVARLHQGQVNVGVSVAPAFHAALTSGATEGAYRGETLEGTPSYVTWRRSAFSGWAVGIGVPATSVEAGAWRALAIGLLGVGVSLALALVLARLLARRISEPVALLAAQARALRRDNSRTSLPHANPAVLSLPATDPGAASNEEEPSDHNAVGPAGLDIREMREMHEALTDAAEAMHALGRARANAESANRAKDEFLAMLGHELRNPLSAITAAAHVLRKRPDGPAATHARNVLQRQTAHLTKLVDDLLDASRVSQGKIELERQALDLAALAQRVATQVVDSSPKHRLILRLEAAWVSGDDTRLEQIVTNLVSNAVRYSPDGGPIELVVTRSIDGVVLSVRDEGVGMASELLPRVFDLFVQGARGVARSQGGLGIGLTLAHRLAELHGGRLEACSAGEGQGSTFTLTLPAVEPPMADETQALPASRLAGRQLGILLVDDNDDGRGMLREVLEVAGHQVTEAMDGQQALDLAATGAFDVALIDIGLPGIDGLEVARRLRGMGPPLSLTLLVAITGYGSPEDHARSSEVGFDLHVVKPIDGVDLLNQIQDLLLQRWSPAATGR